MTRKKLFFSLVVLLLGLATCYADDKDSPNWRLRWKEAISQWTETKTTNTTGVVAPKPVMISPDVDAERLPPPLAASWSPPAQRVVKPLPSTAAVPACLPQPCMPTALPAPIIDGDVQQAGLLVPCEDVTIDLMPPVGLAGRLAVFLGQCCGKALCETYISGATLPSPTYLNHPPQFTSPCSRIPTPVMCSGSCLPPSSECLPTPAKCGSSCFPPPATAPCTGICCPGACPMPGSPAMPCPQSLPCVSMPCPPVAVPPPPVVYAQPMPYVAQPMPYVIMQPAYPAPVVPPSTIPVTITLDASGNKPTLKVELPNGSVIKCKKFTLTPFGEGPVTVSVAKDRIKVKGKDFNGFARKVTNTNQSINIELYVPQSDVVSSPCPYAPQ